MRRFILYLLLPLLLFAGQAWGATYTVTQSGSGADYSIAQFNALTGTSYAGDTFYFSGTITSTISVTISGTSGGGDVVLDGYQAGDCDPINSECTSSALIDHSSTFGIWNGSYSTGQNYITIQDFRVTNVIHGMYFCAGSSHLTFKRNYVHDCEHAGIRNTHGSGFTASYVTIGGASGDGNKITNCGQNDGENLCLSYFVNDLVISYNEMGIDDKNTYGREGLYIYTCNRVLIEYNTVYDIDIASGGGEQCISAKGLNSDVIIRFNDVSGANGNGIHVVNYNQDFYVYGNRAYDNGGAGIGIGTQNTLSWEGGNSYPENIHVFSNLLYDNESWGVYTSLYGCSVYSCTLDKVYIYNNTIVGNGGYNYQSSGFYCAYGTNIYFKNNILSNNVSNSAEQEIWTNNSTNITLGDNLYYDATGAATLTGISMEGDATEADPKFVNTAASDYTLLGTSPALDAGTDLSGCFDITIQGTNYHICYDDALGKNTDWTTTPPTIEILNRDDLGWDRGAYVYESPSEDPPVQDASYTWESCPSNTSFPDQTNSNDFEVNEGNPTCDNSDVFLGSQSLNLDGDDSIKCTDANCDLPMDNSLTTNEFTIYSWIKIDDDTQEACFYIKGNLDVDDDASEMEDAADIETAYWVSYHGNSGDAYEDKICVWTYDETAEDWEVVCGTKTYCSSGCDIDIDDRRILVAVSYNASGCDECDGTNKVHLMTWADNSSAMEDDAEADMDIAKNASPVTLGGEYNPTGETDRFLQGHMEDVYFFSTEQTVAEIDAYWDSTKGGTGGESGISALSTSANATSSGNYTITVTKDIEGYVTGDQPYFDVTFDYPTTRRFYRSGKSGTSTYFTAILQAGDRQDSIGDDQISDSITVPGTWKDIYFNDIIVTDVLKELGEGNYPSHTIAVPFDSANAHAFTDAADPSDWTAGLLDGDYFELSENCDDGTGFDWSASAFTTNFNGNGYQLTGDIQWNDGDGTGANRAITERLQYGSTVVLGNNSINRYSLIPEGDTVQIPTGHTGVQVYNYAIRGTLDVDADTDGIYNTWATAVDLAGITTGEDVNFYNCAFVQSQAAIEDTLPEEGAGTATFDADCKFEINTTNSFTNYAGADFTLKAGSSLINGGDNSVHSGTNNVLDLTGHTITTSTGTVAVRGDTVDIGCHEYGLAASYTIGTGGTYATYTLMLADLGCEYPGDTFTIVSAITDDIDTVSAGTASSRITLDGAGYLITGDVTFDQNYWTIIDVNVTGTLTASGDYITWQ